MKSKRGLAFQTVVLAILAMVVLAILSYLLIKGGETGGELLKCERRGGVCVSTTCAKAGYSEEMFTGCHINDEFNEDHHCCLKISKK